MASETRVGQGVPFEIPKCPACHRNIAVSLVDGEIYRHQESEWSTEVCEQTGNEPQQFTLGVKIGQPQVRTPKKCSKARQSCER